MRIIIFSEGGSNIGLGHISRCISLYNEIKKREITVDFIINGDIEGINILKGIHFTNENWINKNYLQNTIKADNYIIVDSYNANIDLVKNIAKYSKKSVFIDDTGRLEYPQGIIVNPSLNVESLNYSQSIAKMVLSGPKYIIVKTPFVGIKREITHNSLKKILIIMGGTDIRNLIPLFIENVCKVLPNIKFNIVLGLKVNSKLYSDISDISNITIHTNISATQMVDLMVNSDTAITAAGQTIYELLATQTPFIPIQIIENQKNNITSLLKYIPNHIVLKYDDSALSEKILNALKVYEKASHRNKLIKNYKGLVDGYGSKRIVDKLLS